MRFAFLTDAQITYNWRVLDGAAKYAMLHGGLQVRFMPVTEPAQLAKRDAEGYDGFLIGTIFANSKEAGALRTPTVNVSSTFLDLRFPRVVSDEKEYGRIVAKHFLDKGYRNLAFCGSPTGWATLRWKGFSSAVQDALGKEFAPVWEADNTIPREEWLSSPTLPRPLGLMACNDATAFEVVEICHKLGLRVPEDVAVVGVDDDDLFVNLSNPTLSSVTQQYERIGYLATDCLMRLVRGDAVPQLTLVPPGTLIPRYSSGSVAVADQIVVQAIQFMQGSLQKRADIADVAEAMGVSLRSLELRFKAALGRTPRNELSRLKIERAQNLLATTSLSLKEIATVSGFGTPIQLNDKFKNYTGLTPAGYRRQYTHDVQGLKVGKRH